MQIFAQKKRKNLHFALDLRVFGKFWGILLHHNGLNSACFGRLQNEQIIAC